MIFSIDPSISCTGFGLLEWPSPHLPRGRVIECGAITPPDSGSSWERIRKSLVIELADLARSLMESHPVTTVVVETPQDYAVGLSGKRSAATLPTYGMAVGAVLATMDAMRVAWGFELVEVSASVWTRYAPAARKRGDSGRSIADPHKLARVEEVRQTWPGVVLPKSQEKAAGAADALLIGRWCMLERKRNRVG